MAKPTNPQGVKISKVHVHQIYAGAETTAEGDGGNIKCGCQNHKM